MKRFEVKATSILQGILLLLISVVLVKGQSTNVNFPTPITTDSITGNIKARDIGDSRLTSHYYFFEGRQGDIFLKIQSNNLDGDIDIYYADNLRPITKIKLFSDSSPTETGREIYLRKNEKLILRVEGRTPNDDSASYSINFSGSFQSVAANSVPSETKTPEAKTSTNSDIRVNSVGTIIERKPTPTPQQKTETSSKPETSSKNEPITRRREVSSTTTTPQPDSTIKSKTASAKKEVEEDVKKTETSVKEASPKPTKSTPTKTTTAKANTTKRTTPVRSTPTRTTPTIKKETPKVEPKPNPATELAAAMENVKLIVLFKDGKKIERPMNDVLRFGVDKGTLTIINKNGSISRHSILEISKITVE